MSEKQHDNNPTDFGWTKTGSNEVSRVEFYSKDNVKMDYYPTTGTVKTSMDHPTQGKTQMFRRDITNNEYVNVLNDPRHHTGKGYQTKK